MTWFFPHARDKLHEVDDGDSPFETHGDGYQDVDPPDVPENIEDEIISVNANESDLGGSKYAIMHADVIAFESSAQRDFNNSEVSFNFRRSMARDKPVSRAISPVECTSTAVNNITYGTGDNHLYSSRDEVFLQILNETTWASLAYGFMPAIHKMFTVEEGCFGDDDELDEFYNVIRASGIFWTEPPYGIGEFRRGYTNIFQWLHQAGWQPVTNTINVAQSDSDVNGDPQDLVINRFGPYEAAIGPSLRPVYITLLNNESISLTMTDIAEYDCEGCIPIGGIESEYEVEMLGICEDTFGRVGAFDDKRKNILDPIISQKKDRYFMLEIMDPSKLALGSVGNLKGHQMVGHEKPAIAPVNDPDIHADVFGETGAHYSILRLNAKLRLGGTRFSGQPQQYGVIEDKALLVFRIWVDPVGDNSTVGGEREGSEEDPYYRTFGRGWSEIGDPIAENGTFDSVSTTVPGACASYRIDTGSNGTHRLRVKHPVYQTSTSLARYDVYVMCYLQDAFHTLTLDELTAPALTVVLDQTRETYIDIDDDGFAAIGEFEVNGLADSEWVSVVIKVSVEPDETGQVAPATLVADALKLEAVE